MDNEIKETDMNNLPKDPVMLLSVVNTNLRDFYSNLDEFCKAKDADKQEIIEEVKNDWVYIWMKKKISLCREWNWIKKSLQIQKMKLQGFFVAIIKIEKYLIYLLSSGTLNCLFCNVLICGTYDFAGVD